MPTPAFHFISSPLNVQTEHDEFSLSDSSMDEILLDEVMQELDPTDPGLASANFESSGVRQLDCISPNKEKGDVSLNQELQGSSQTKMYTLFSQRKRSNPSEYDQNNNECAQPLTNMCSNQYSVDRSDAILHESYKCFSGPEIGSSSCGTDETSQSNTHVEALETSHLSVSTEEESICRICHEGESREGLISPCKCTGTMAMIHQTCIERWLGAANLNRCEVCNFQYITERQPRPLMDWLRKPGRSMDKRNLVGDFLCFVLLSPLAAISAWLCLTGALHYKKYQNTEWETAGLCTLSAFLIIIYFVWCAVAVRYHIKVFLRWRQTNQIVRVVNLNMCTSKAQNSRPSSAFNLVSALFGTSYASVFSRGQNTETGNYRVTGSMSSPAIQMFNEEEGSVASVHKPQRKECCSCSREGFKPQVSLSDTVVLLAPDFKWQAMNLKETAV